MITLNHYLILGAVLFSLSVAPPTRRTAEGRGTICPSN